MFDDLDKTLETLLRDGLRKELRDQVAITFAAPDSTFPPTSFSLPAIDLFLYDIRENRELRSSEPVIERTADGRALQAPPPVRIDCSYLITAWAAEGPDAAAGEHALLGDVLRVLLRASTIPAAALQGSLRDEDALPVSSLQPGRLQSIGELWQATGSRPKAALHFTVTVPIRTQKAEEVHLVTERVLKIGLGKAVDR